MKTYLSRFAGIALALAFVLSLTAYKPDNDNNPTSPVATEAPAESPTTFISNLFQNGTS